MPPRFAELCGRSNFSFLEGASHPEEMVERARELELEAIALCDRDGLYGSARAHIQAKSIGQPLIIGAELTVEGLGDLAVRVGLCVETHEGYGQLCRLLTRAHADHEKGQAGIDVATLASSSRGLTPIVPMQSKQVASCDALFGPLRDTFGDKLCAATWRHLDGRDRERTEAAREAQRRYGARVIATSRPLFHHPARRPLADVVHCIRHKTTLDRAGRALTGNAEARLRSAEQMLALFRDEPAWVEDTALVAERCTFSLSELRYRFPSDELCEEGETPNEALARLVGEGLRVRYPSGPPASVTGQIDKELALIADLDVASYFLSVQQVVQIARSRGILCQGRGSAANSAVCYVLGVTAVDPAKSELLFERFLSAERAEPPDIDVDFEHERREEVIQELYAIYGRDRAAMVSEIIAYRGKSAVREVGKVFGLGLDQIDRLSKIVMRHDLGDVTAERVRDQGLDPADDRIREVLAMAGALNGAPRHLSIHVGGFVLSAEPLHHVAPIEPARMEGRTVIPWDKDDLDALGFFKVDVLGLGMLTAIRKALAMVHEQEHGASAPFDPIEALASIPPEDPAVYEAVGHADTVGVFQIESRAQMAMLPRLKPKCFYDLVIEVAIVRPGPIQGGMVHPYLRRRTGEEPATSPHPCLDPILKRTMGVPLFQEQVMQIAMVGAGYTAGEADQLRRDMAAWKRHGRLERHRARLLEGFAKRGIAPEFGERLYLQVQGFGEYGFPESHAASFALLVYASAWLKVHHPTAFACALLNSQPMGFYSASSIVRDAQKHGVEVRPVCIVASDWDCTLEPSSPSSSGLSAGGVAMRLGFRQVTGFGETAGRAIERVRSEAPLTSIEDLVHRTNIRKNEVEALAEAGAFEALIAGRRHALWRAHAPRVSGLFEGVPVEPAGARAVDLPPLRPVEQLVLDYRRVGLSLHDHPMCHVRGRFRDPPYARRRIARAQDLESMRDRQSVEVAGLVIGRQRPMTASGVTFVTLEDETGVVNLVVPEKVFSEHYLAARHAKLLLVRGRVERQGEVIHVLARTLERLDGPSDRDLVARSRDFH